VWKALFYQTPDQPFFKQILITFPLNLQKEFYNRSHEYFWSDIKEYLKMKIKVAITGGAGFIGSNLTFALLSRGYAVEILDNFYTGSKKNLNSFKNEPDLTITEHDIRTPLDIRADIIINLACPASPPHYQKDPIYTWETSVYGISNLLKTALKNKAKLLHASTSEVYGDPLEHPQNESYWGNVNPIGIRSCYDEGKRAAETIITDYKRVHNINASIFRIFNTYGPLMQPDDGRVVSNFSLQNLAKKPYTIYGKGDQTRSFCYVDDLVKGIILMMEYEKPMDTPVNLGNPHEFTIKQLAEVIDKETGYINSINYQPLPSDDPVKRKPDIALAQKILGWNPEVSLQQGIQPTLAYFKNFI